MKAPVVAMCDRCRLGYIHMRATIQTALCLTAGCKGVVFRLPKGDSRNEFGEATYAVPVSRFPPIAIPKPLR